MLECSTNYAVLGEDCRANRNIVGEELDYLARTWGFAKESSMARLRSWAKRFPWIRSFAAERGVSL